MGVWSDATDGYDADFEYLLPPSTTGYAGVFHSSNPPAWTGPTGYYLNDFRARLADEQSMTWSPIALWALPEYTDPEMYLSFQADSLFPPTPDREYVLELLYVPKGLQGAPPVGTRWNVRLDQTLTVGVPTYRALDGSEAYQFSFTAGRVIPEPLAVLLATPAMLFVVCRRANRPAA